MTRVALVFTLLLAACVPGEWRTVTFPDAEKRADLVERGWLPEVVAETADRVVMTYNLDTNRVFLRAAYAKDGLSQFSEQLIPADKADAVALANAHPPNGLEGWDEITIQARLRTGAMPLRRMRDGSNWRFSISETGQVWGWNVPEAL